MNIVHKHGLMHAPLLLAPLKVIYTSPGPEIHRILPPISPRCYMHIWCVIQTSGTETYQHVTSIFSRTAVNPSWDNDTSPNLTVPRNRPQSHCLEETEFCFWSSFEKQIGGHRFLFLVLIWVTDRKTQISVFGPPLRNRLEEADFSFWSSFEKQIGGHRFLFLILIWEISCWWNATWAYAGLFLCHSRKCTPFQEPLAVKFFYIV